MLLQGSECGRKNQHTVFHDSFFSRRTHAKHEAMLQKFRQSQEINLWHWQHIQMPFLLERSYSEWCPQILRQACLQENPEGAMCVQNLNDSRGLAIRITYRISLRSSSLWEPRHPPLKVVCQIFLVRVGHLSVKNNQEHTPTLFTSGHIFDSRYF